MSISPAIIADWPRLLRRNRISGFNPFFSKSLPSWATHYIAASGLRPEQPMRILSAARLGEANTNELRNSSNATTFTPFGLLNFSVYTFTLLSHRARDSLKSDQVTLSSCSKFPRQDRVFQC